LIITAFYRRIGRTEPLKIGWFFGSKFDWLTKSTETRPDGTERIVSSNARTQPMLEVFRTTDGLTILLAAAKAQAVATAKLEPDLEQSHWLYPLQDRSVAGTAREGMLPGFSLPAPWSQDNAPRPRNPGGRNAKRYGSLRSEQSLLQMANVRMPAGDVSPERQRPDTGIDQKHHVRRVLRVTTGNQRLPESPNRKFR
jgi:hypothetical protein